VQTRSPQQFAEAILHYIRLSDEERRSVATNARDRVATMFPLSSAVDQHEALYRHVLGLAPKADMMEEAVPSGEPIRRASDLA
jgi:hypothetical protein